MRQIRNWIAAALVFVVAAGCGSQGDYDNIKDAGVQVDGGMLIDVTAGDASKLLSFLAADSTSGDISDLIFSGLTRYNHKLELEGDLAESWNIENGGKKITFKLRKGVRWTDGKPFTSADVKFTWQIIMDPKTATPRKSGFELVSRVDTPDPQTVVIYYKEPYARALESWGIGIAPKHLLEKEEDINKSKYNREPVGLGPFKFKKWVSKQYIELEANPDWWRGKSKIDRYVLKIVPEPATQLLELKADQIDQMALSPDQFAKETDDSRFKRVARKFQFPGMSRYTYLGFNNARKPFDDKKVRLALSMAVDRKAIIDGVVLGYGKPCTGPYSPLVPAYNHDVKEVPLDLEGAGKLLDEAGWRLGSDGIREKDGKKFEFSIITNSGNPSREKIVVILQQQFSKIGVKAKVQTYEWSVFLSNFVDVKNFDAVVLGWQLSLDPDLYSIFHSSQVGEQQFNFVSYSNPEVDRLLEKGRSMVDPEARIPVYRRVHALIAEDQPYAFLYAPDTLAALHKRFQGLYETDKGYSWYWEERWYVPKSVQRTR